MTETIPTINELEQLVERLRFGSAILFATLQSVYTLHDVDAIESEEEGEEPTPVCKHCSEVAGEFILYPCPTAQILLEEFVVDPVSPEAQPSAGQSEPDETSDLHQSDEEASSADPS